MVSVTNHAAMPGSLPLLTRGTRFLITFKFFPSPHFNLFISQHSKIGRFSQTPFSGMVITIFFKLNTDYYELKKNA